MLSLIHKNISKHWCLLLVLIVMVAGVGEVKGQRIYADAEAHSDPQVLIVTLSQVTNPGRAVDLADLTNFSTLSANIGALGLIEAWQNIRYTGTNKPIASTPITIKFGSTTSLLSLLDGISIQPTLNGVLVGTAYSSSTVLSLLSAIGTPVDAEITLPAPGIVYDGIRLKVSSSLLGAALSSKLYYASFIVAPTVNSATICSGNTVDLLVTNTQTNYTYNWYTSSTGGTLLQSSTSTTFTTPSLNTTTTYYVEAVQTVGGTYYSGRTPVTVTVNPLPATPTPSSASLSVCSGNTASLSISSPLAGITYNWYTVASGGTIVATGTSFSPTVNADIIYYVEAVNNTTLCKSAARASVSITAKPLPNLTSSLNPSVCSGTNFSYTATSNVGSTSFSWTRAAVTGITTSDVSSGTTNLISQTLTNNTQLPIDVTYIFILTANGCPKTTNVILKVNPKPGSLHIVSQ